MCDLAKALNTVSAATALCFPKKVTALSLITHALQNPGVFSSRGSLPPLPLNPGEACDPPVTNGRQVEVMWLLRQDQKHWQSFHLVLWGSGCWSCGVAILWGSSKQFPWRKQIGRSWVSMKTERCQSTPSCSSHCPTTIQARTVQLSFPKFLICRNDWKQQNDCFWFKPLSGDLLHSNR